MDFAARWRGSVIGLWHFWQSACCVGSLTPTCRQPAAAGRYELIEIDAMNPGFVLEQGIGPIPRSPRWASTRARDRRAAEMCRSWHQIISTSALVFRSAAVRALRRVSIFGCRLRHTGKADGRPRSGAVVKYLILIQNNPSVVDMFAKMTDEQRAAAYQIYWDVESDLEVKSPVVV